MPVEPTGASQLSHLFLAGASSLLGLVFYLIAMNRLLNYFRDGPYKFKLAVIILLVMVVGFGWSGYTLDVRLSTWLLGLGFGMVALGEARQIWVRRSCLGEAPVVHHGPIQSWRRPVTTTDLQSLYYQVNLAGWNGRRFRVVQLSDLHLNARLPWAYYDTVVEITNQAEADLVFITGDFVTGLGCIEQLPRFLRGLHSQHGVYGIFGNHDYWAGIAQVKDAVQRGCVQLLGAAGQPVYLDARQAIWLVGCDAPWSGVNCWSPDILAGQCVIGLSHSADYIYPLNQAGVKVVFSGHTHAGQFQLPGLGPVFTPSRYGRLFHHGHFYVGGTHLFVSAGIGCAEPSLRLYCPPEILIVDFNPEQPEPGSLE